MDVKHTGRGFELLDFTDSHGHKCSIQESSADGAFLWIGPNDARPIILASQAAAHGVVTQETTGWVAFPVPDAVQMTTRAHVGREQVAAIVRHLQAWLDTGSLVPFAGRAGAGGCGSVNGMASGSGGGPSNIGGGGGFSGVEHLDYGFPPNCGRGGGA